LVAEGGRTVTVTLPLTEPPRPSVTVTRSWKGVLVVTCGAVQVGLAVAGSLNVPAGV
jgi:hypothetical protein